MLDNKKAISNKIDDKEKHEQCYILTKNCKVMLKSITFFVNHTFYQIKML